MKKILYTILFLLLGEYALAQGRYAGASMELGVGARPLALGGAAAALSSTGETFFYNPSSLGLLEKPHLNFMYAPTFGSFLEPMANYNYLGGVYPMHGGGVIAFNWTRFAVDDIPIYPELKGASFAERNKDLTLRPDGTALGYFEDVEDVFYFSFAKTLESILPLGWWYGDLPMTMPFGINFKLLRHKLGGASASGIGVDAGMMIKFNLGTLVNQRQLGDLSFGLSFLDMTKTAIIWNTKHEDYVKQTLMFGMAYSQALWFSNASVNIYYTYHEKYEKQHLSGIEFAIKGIAVRIGKNENGMTTGAGLNWRRFFVDYAFVNNAFEDVHRISCSIRL
ncbi:hypothetical protein EH223_02860 [candidate division KSB1 bacterium]|nr:hypothetical protein [candidate division KSB1 bacterium]RQW06081.1 MAG: hypothetical protein EH223_02860 [candidate division KSB1 bacterium]